MSLMDWVWPWGALSKARKQAALKEQRQSVADIQHFSWSEAQAKLINDLRSVIAAQDAMLRLAYFRDPDTGRFLDQGVLPTANKEVLTI